MNLPDFEFKIKKENEKYQIFDRIRRTFVALTPEEWVRQNVVNHLIENLAYPANSIANEVSITYNKLKKRCDSIVYDDDFAPIVIAEYKAESVEITQTVFDQASVYNKKLNVPYLLISNGLVHLFCYVDRDNKKLLFFEQIPDYQSLITHRKSIS